MALKRVVPDSSVKDCFHSRKVFRLKCQIKETETEGEGRRMKGEEMETEVERKVGVLIGPTRQKARSPSMI